MNLSELSDEDFANYKMREWPALMRAQSMLEEPVDERYDVLLQTVELLREDELDALDTKCAVVLQDLDSAQAELDEQKRGITGLKETLNNISEEQKIQHEDQEPWDETNYYDKLDAVGEQVYIEDHMGEDA